MQDQTGIGQSFNQATLGDAPIGAFVYDTLKLGLKRAEQAKACVDGIKVAMGNGVRFGADRVGHLRKPEELADVIDLEAKFSSTADEPEAFDRVHTIRPATTRRALRR